jgi:hypothetical protein
VARDKRRVQTAGGAVDAFLARRDLAVSSRRSYGQTLNRLSAGLGHDRVLGLVDAAAIDVVLTYATKTSTLSVRSCSIATGRPTPRRRSTPRLRGAASLPPLIASAEPSLISKRRPVIGTRWPVMSGHRAAGRRCAWARTDDRPLLAPLRSSSVLPPGVSRLPRLASSRP